ncbi:kinesin-related protein [Klebsormidium nitens]|uniref:Kinesin-related protein n=1 Tax=Klebsormidium nitens TaxID=105231 RepID=A0A1Y1HSX9_KLENI|nr:kinesin-related protein [Klebsormidium nitens]|eukprot:GAQ81725.1 kinesin-related protein [Klebsormidium nitens]
MKLSAVEEAVSWIGELTGVWLDSDGFDFCEQLCDGDLLVKVARSAAPSALDRIHISPRVLATQTESAAVRDIRSSGTPLKRDGSFPREDRLGWVERTRYQAKFNAMESITTFLAVCRAAGCKKEDLFSAADLTEHRDAERVARGLLALRVATASRGASLEGDEKGEGDDPLVQTLRRIELTSSPPSPLGGKHSKTGFGRERRSTGEGSSQSLDEAANLDDEYDAAVWPESPVGREERPAFGGGPRSPSTGRTKRSDSVTSTSSAVSAYGSSLTALGVKSPEEFDTIRKFARRLASKDRVVKELTGAIQAANDREERMRARLAELETLMGKGGNGAGGGTGDGPLSRTSSAGTVTADQLDALVGDVRRQLEEAKNELSETKRAYGEAVAECEESRRQCAEFRTDLEIAQREVSEVREELAGQGGTRDAELSRVLRELEERKKQLEDARAANQRLEKERARAEKGVKKKEKQLRALLLVAQGLREGLARVKREFEAFRAPLLGDMQRVLELGDSLREVGEKYDTVRKENKRLHNEIIDLKGNIRVFCRVRPLSHKELRDGAFAAATCPGDDVILVKQQQGVKAPSYKFSFDKVYGGNATQEEVFSEVEGIIRSVIDGYNVCIFAYGQTGSGKTHTMSGPSGQLDSKSVGVNYRALDLLFGLRSDRSAEWDFDIGVEMVEIYNETIRDLLMNVTSTNGRDSRDRKKLQMRMKEDGNRSADASRVAVFTPEDVLAVMDSGGRNRATGSTSMNERSSRSHCIVTVRVDGLHKVTGEHVSSSLHLVDLAGSERISKSEATGDRLKEAQHINKSLSALGDVIAALVEKRPHIPYRNSKLTQILQTALGGQSKALMFAHVSPESGSVSETVSTLNFAQRVKQVELGKANQNKGSLAEMKELMMEKERELQEMDARVRQADAAAAEEARVAVQAELAAATDEAVALRRAVQALEQENRALKLRAEQAQKQGPRELDLEPKRAAARPPKLQIPPAEITVGDGERTPTENGRVGSPRAEARPRRRSRDVKLAKSAPNLEVRRKSNGRSSDGETESSSDTGSVPVSPSRKRGEGSSIPLPVGVGVARGTPSGSLSARERVASAQPSAPQHNGSGIRRSSGAGSQDESTSDEEMSARIFAAAAPLGRNGSLGQAVPGSPTGHKPRPVTAGAKPGSAPGLRRRSSDGPEGIIRADPAVSAQKRPVTAAPSGKVARPTPVAGAPVAVRKSVEGAGTASSKPKASTRSAASSNAIALTTAQAKPKSAAAPGKIWA